MQAQVAALLEEREINRRQLAVETERQRLEAELQVDERKKLEKDKEDWARNKEAEKRKAEEVERRAERERKKADREENERRWAAERKEKEEKKKDEESASKGEKKKSYGASFEWDEPDDSDEEVDFHFEGRALPPGMLELARDARRHQDVAITQNLAVAHTMTARKYMSKLRVKGELPVSFVH